MIRSKRNIYGAKRHNREIPILRASDSRHGSSRVQRGKLRAQTDTDYLVIECPECGFPMRKGDGLQCEGYWINGSEGPLVLLFEFRCPDCGMHDYFKVAVDNAGRYEKAREAA